MKIKVDLSPFCVRARNFLSKGQVDDAIDLFGDVIKVDPEFSLAYADRGVTYAMIEKYDLALKDLEKAFSMGYEDASAYSAMATILYQLKDYESSLKYFDLSIKKDPAYPISFYNRSNVFFEMGDMSSAVADLEACLRFNPDEKMKAIIYDRLNLIKGKIE
ncbi:tetratricopeptide repeat protein [Hahella sp. NBU794]|uniref:tetratricopeptide repeat protein n=1 Tax=Hahella sp. NBU794 TaxID=3422590 RepID=UPI003D6FB722